MKSHTINILEEVAEKNIQISVNRIMNSLQTIQNSKQLLIENDDFIKKLLYKQIA